LSARLERHHALRKVRLRLRLRFVQRSLQWQLPQRSAGAHFEEQQWSPIHARAEWAGPVAYRHQGVEPIASDWSLVFKFENGFAPYTLQRASGPKSLVENNTTPVDAQTANGDSSRAGQLLNTEAYLGFSRRTYGEMTAGRQNSLIVNGANLFDPMGAASSFSVVGVSNTAAGGGETQDARYNTSLKYRIGVGPFHFAGLYQFGGFDQGNGSNGAFSLWMTGDFGPLTFGVEADKNKDAVSYSNFAQFPLPPGVSANSLKATLSSNTSGVLGVRYTFGNAALYSGWKYILFANPSDAYPDGFCRDWQLPRPSRLCAQIEKLIYFGGDGRASGIARPSAGGRRASLPTRGYSSGESRPNSPAWRGAPLRQSVDELEVVRLDGGGRAPCVVNQSRCDKFQVRRMKRV
jgi:hypothetical protein